METLIKTIRKLTAEEFEQMVEEVTGNRKNKPYKLLMAIRDKDFSDSAMMEYLEVSPSSYYTLKSRLSSKMAAVLSSKMDNPISGLLQEVDRIPALLYGNSREMAIRALKELEKQLVRYDLSKELIEVYNGLALLQVYNDDYEFYQQEYNKHVAFSLAVTKAERHFFEFLQKTGQYYLTLDETDRENLQLLRRELSNIGELYVSHRLFVINSIVKLIWIESKRESIQELKNRELDIDFLLQEISEIFEKHTLDPFYQNIKFIVPLFYFSYYLRTENMVRAEYYYEQLQQYKDEFTEKFNFNFFTLQYLFAQFRYARMTNKLDTIQATKVLIDENIDITADEHYHYIAYHKYKCLLEYYAGNYKDAAFLLHTMRGEISTRNYLHADIEMKLLQAFQYAVMGEENLCMQLANSVRRQVKDERYPYENALMFIKLLKAVFKEQAPERKTKRINELWKKFKILNECERPVLTDIEINETVLEKMMQAYYS